MRLLTVMAVLFLAIGCSAIGTSEPTISDSLMVELLTDLHLADSRQEVIGDMSDAVRDSVLLNRGVSRSNFDAAVAFYSKNPERYLSIYNEVIDNLTSEQPAAARDDSD